MSHKNFDFVRSYFDDVFPPLSFLSMIIANGSRLHLPNNADSQFWATFISGYLQKTLDHWRSHTHTHTHSLLSRTHCLSLSLLIHKHAFSLYLLHAHTLSRTLSLSHALATKSRPTVERVSTQLVNRDFRSTAKNFFDSKLLISKGNALIRPTGNSHLHSGWRDTRRLDNWSTW